MINVSLYKNKNLLKNRLSTFILMRPIGLTSLNPYYQTVLHSGRQLCHTALAEHAVFA